MSGRFIIGDDGVLTCIITNLARQEVILEGLRHEVLRAKFYGKDGEPIEVGVRRFPTNTGYQEWTRLLAQSPDGGRNPGSTYVLALLEPNLPRVRDLSKVQTFVIDVALRPIIGGRELGPPRKVKCRFQITGAEEEANE
ncbi:MAG: hypothetical protein O3A92_10075 [Verrucomicrobia bacterium]|nr:hypothetical protein [Verrucomicrobiota bacterium]